jgi:hypothetical protein
MIESRAKLMQAAKKLMADWQQAKEAWRDDNCQQFDKQYMSPLESSIRTAALAMERVETLLESAQQDCADGTGLDP